jgi:hypothetical protein
MRYLNTASITEPFLHCLDWQPTPHVLLAAFIPTPAPLAIYRTITFTHTPLIRGGGHVSPSPGSRRGPGDYPSYTSLVRSINSSGTKYVSTMGVQYSLQDLIEDLKNMSKASAVPRIDLRAMLIELDASTYSSR